MVLKKVKQESLLCSTIGLYADENPKVVRRFVMAIKKEDRSKHYLSTIVFDTAQIVASGTHLYESTVSYKWIYETDEERDRELSNIKEHF